MASFKQDMPPPGGYQNVEWAKKATKGVNGKKMFAIWLGVNVGVYFWYKQDTLRRRALDLEMREGRIALQPLLEAEQDRLYLRQLRKNRDEENDLMRYVPGWETGTLYGEPLYHNKHRQILPFCWEEYYAHAKFSDKVDRMFVGSKH